MRIDVRPLRSAHPGNLRIAIHTALTDEAGAREMEAAGVDVAMLDIIGAQETIRDVYHLERPVEDFESTLAALCATSMQISPHIVIGLHYGRILGEENALDILSRHETKALVLVVIMYLRDAGDRRCRTDFPRGPAPAAGPPGAAGLCPAARHAQARHRCVRGNGRARRHRLSSGRCGGSGRHDGSPVSPGPCLLLDQTWRK
jgi:hypothetical protein